MIDISKKVILIVLFLAAFYFGTLWGIGNKARAYEQERKAIHKYLQIYSNSEEEKIHDNFNLPYCKLEVIGQFITFDGTYRIGDTVYLLDIDTFGVDYPWGVSKWSNGFPDYIGNSNYSKMKLVKRFKVDP